MHMCMLMKIGAVKREGERRGVIKAQVLYNDMSNVPMTSTKLFLSSFDPSPS